MTVEEAVEVLGAERYAQIRDDAMDGPELTSDQLSLLGGLFGGEPAPRVTDRAA